MQLQGQNTVPRAGTLTYEWKSGADLVGTGSTYQVQATDIAKLITVAVTVQGGLVLDSPKTVSAAAGPVTEP